MSKKIWIAIVAIGAVGIFAFWQVMLRSFAQHPAPDVLGLGKAFEGSLQLPAATIQNVFDVARRQMLDVNSGGIHFRTAATVVSGACFVITAAITVIMAWLRGGASKPKGGAAKPPGEPAPGPQLDLSGLRRRDATIISVLAALAAVLTAAGNLALVKSQDQFKRADEIHDLITHARAQVLNAKTADEAQSVLDDVALKAARWSE